MNDLSKLIDLGKLLTDQEVKQRRGWHTEKCGLSDQWVVPQLLEITLRHYGREIPDAVIEACYQQGHDVGLLTKADAWFTANIEAKEQP